MRYNNGYRSENPNAFILREWQSDIKSDHENKSSACVVDILSGCVGGEDGGFTGIG